MLSVMKMEWLERDPTAKWVVGIEDTTKPYPEPFMALIPCEMKEEKKVFLY